MIFYNRDDLIKKIDLGIKNEIGECFECPECGGYMYIIEETPAGDEVYQCVSCFEKIGVVA